MSREIKFRAWDEKRKTYREFGTYKFGLLLDDHEGVMESTGYDSYDSPCNFESLSDHIILEQYTGLKDRNGKEIYEGDIMHSEQWNPKSYVVIFEDGAFGFSAPSVPYYMNSLHYLEKFEIIGNIHENPELLESLNE